MKIDEANTRGALIALVSFAIFSGADTVVKVLSERFALFQVTFGVTSLALLFLVVSAAGVGKIGQVVPRDPVFAGVRGLLLAGDMILIYYAFSTVSLTDAYILAFLAPIMVAVLAAIFLGERLSMIGYGGIALGFAGVLVVMRPGQGEVHLGHFAAIGSALLFAITLLMLRRAKAHENDLALSAAPLAILAVLAFIIMMATSGLPSPSLTDCGLFLLGGFFLFLGNILLVRAFRTGAASVVAPFQYSQIIWGAGFGLFVFGAPIELATMLGGLIIIFSGWLVLK